MLTPTRLEEVAAWMRVNAVPNVVAVNSDSIHLTAAEFRRIAPDATGIVSERPFRCVDYTSTVDGQTVIAVDMDLDAYTAYQDR